MIVTRFAPSPTGYLHLGGARTALFNKLYARRHGGVYLVRIEDTDRERSSPEALANLQEGLAWLDLAPDRPYQFQSHQAEAHRALARRLVREEKAYWCPIVRPAGTHPDTHPDTHPGRPHRSDSRDPTSERPSGRPSKRPGTTGFKSPYRDQKIEEKHGETCCRLKLPLSGHVQIEDAVQGLVTFENAQLEDFVLLRSDGTPTYALSVVADDHQADVTHIIRGDDHLVNAAKQVWLYRALGWRVPTFAHIPLLHGADGQKFSKRHGAADVGWYRQQGVPPEALVNYLLRLGWSHGDREFFSFEEAAALFSLEAIGRSSARFDLKKLKFYSAHFIRHETTLETLVARVVPFLPAHAGEAAHSGDAGAPRPDLKRCLRHRLKPLLPALRTRCQTLVELGETAGAFLNRPSLSATAWATNLEASSLTPSEATDLLAAMRKVVEDDMRKVVEDASDFAETDSLKMRLKEAVRTYQKSRNLPDNFSQGARLCRLTLLGKPHGPDVAETMRLLGKEETLARLVAPKKTPEGTAEPDAKQDAGGL